MSGNMKPCQPVTRCSKEKEAAKFKVSVNIFKCHFPPFFFLFKYSKKSQVRNSETQATSKMMTEVALKNI